MKTTQVSINNTSYLSYFVTVPDYFSNTQQISYSYTLSVPRTIQQREVLKGTSESRQLYAALKAKGVEAEIEKYDGFKTIDIVVEKAKLHIEIDGLQHKSPWQGLTDLKRTRYSLRDGYQTIRIPNALIKYELSETVNQICCMCKQRINTF